MGGLVASTSGFTGHRKALQHLRLRCAGVTATRAMHTSGPLKCTHVVARDPGVAGNDKLKTARWVHAVGWLTVG